MALSPYRGDIETNNECIKIVSGLVLGMVYELSWNMSGSLFWGVLSKWSRLKLSWQDPATISPAYDNQTQNNANKHRTLRGDRDPGDTHFFGLVFGFLLRGPARGRIKYYVESIYFISHSIYFISYSNCSCICFLYIYIYIYIYFMYFIYSFIVSLFVFYIHIYIYIYLLFFCYLLNLFLNYIRICCFIYIFCLYLCSINNINKNCLFYWCWTLL